MDHPYKKNRKTFFQNLSVSLGSFLITLILLEIFFRFFFAQSDEFNYTLASKNWFERYWRVNSMGYRDLEWTPDLLEGRTKIMVLGDSFVAGQGIEEPEDRFPDILGQTLGDDYSILNVGWNGSGTREAIQHAQNYPYSADLLVYSYYINDIQDTAIEQGYWPFFQVHSYRLIEYSHAINFLYWRIIRLGPQRWRGRYWNWVLDVYNDPKVWIAYQRDLLQIVELNDHLIVVVWPNILAPEESEPITSKVIDLYTDQGVPVLDVGELITGIEPRDLIANRLDAHPNEFLHHLVAEELYRMVTAEMANQAPRR